MWFVRNEQQTVGEEASSIVHGRRLRNFRNMGHFYTITSSPSRTKTCLTEGYVLLTSDSSSPDLSAGALCTVLRAALETTATASMYMGIARAAWVEQ